MFSRQSCVRESSSTLSGARVFSSQEKCFQSFKGFRFPSVREVPVRLLLLWPPMSWALTGVGGARPDTAWENIVAILLNMAAPDTLLKCGVPFTLSGSVGPLHSDRQYEISASKEGFVLSPVEGNQGDFKAFALAGITFMVHLVVHVECATFEVLYNLYPALSPDVDQVRGWAPPRRCSPVFKWGTVPLQPGDPGHRSAYLQQPGRHLLDY